MRDCWSETTGSEAGDISHFNSYHQAAFKKGFSNSHLHQGMRTPFLQSLTGFGTTALLTLPGPD
jgi:hypothetical protein